MAVVCLCRRPLLHPCRKALHDGSSLDAVWTGCRSHSQVILATVSHCHPNPCGDAAEVYSCSAWLCFVLHAVCC